MLPAGIKIAQPIYRAEHTGWFLSSLLGVSFKGYDKINRGFFAHRIPFKMIFN
jgi:hypothetical protein